jgi:hypothetical protein
VFSSIAAAIASASPYGTDTKPGVNGRTRRALRVVAEAHDRRGAPVEVAVRDDDLRRTSATPLTRYAHAARP